MQKGKKPVMIYHNITPDNHKIMPDDPIDIKLAKARIAQFLERKPYIEKIDRLRRQLSYCMHEREDFLNMLKEVALTKEITGLRIYFALDETEETIFLIYAPTARGLLDNGESELCDRGEYHMFKPNMIGGIPVMKPLDYALARKFVTVFREGTNMYTSPWKALGRQMGDGIDSKCMWYSKEVITNTYEHLMAQSPFDNVYAFFAGYLKEGDVHEIDMGDEIGPILIDKPKHLTLIFSTDLLQFDDPKAYDTGVPCPPEVACGNNELP